MNKFTKDSIYTAGSVLLGAVVGAVLLHQSQPVGPEPAVVEPQAQDPETHKITEREIDYMQWVLTEANKDTEYSIYPDNGIRDDVQFARESMTEEQRFDVWMQLEVIRLNLAGAEINLLAPKNTNILG